MRSGAAPDPRLTLDNLAHNTRAIVISIDDSGPTGERLRELGFAEGQAIRTLATGSFGGDPMAVLLDQHRVALRRKEAALIEVECV